MFTAEEAFHEDGGVFLFRALRDADRRPVVIKALDPRRRGPSSLERLKKEYEFGRTLRTAAAVEPLELFTYRGMPALVMEDFGGEPLAVLLGAPMKLGAFLPLAARITQAVAAIHRQGVVHKDLEPQNIFVNPRTGEVKIAGFGIATRLPRELRTLQPLRLVEGSFPYMSPEQTGRMNRSVDARSDLYSLGVTFYEMLAGRRPFEAADPLGWVHCHIARMPVRLAEVEPSVPEALSAVVMKLLGKVVEERHQSAAGLLHDLERCLASFADTGTIAPFSPGERDISEQLQIPQKLYGREAEIAALLGTFEEVVATGSPALALVSGYPGIGKSSLVHELYKPIVRERGSFLAGKFDQYKRDIPYATLAEAFRSLVLEILADSEERIASVRQKLIEALGEHGQLVIEVIPQVELILGKQPDFPALPLAEAQGRFHTVFRQFLGVFARKEHPLALFLDDLQWADPGSLKLLAHVVTHPDTRYLFLIGSYRDNELDPSHPLLLALDEVKRSGARVRDIVLSPLSALHLGQLVADTIQCRIEEAVPLARLVYDKTAGNPFFAIQFLTTLHQEGLLELDATELAWRWNVERIRAKGFTDNVVDLIVRKVKRLPAATVDALKLAACVGNTASVDTLAALCGRSEDDLHEALWPAEHEGLLLRRDGTYTFVHDRVQEASYSLIPEEQRASVHLRIGRLLLSRTATEEMDERIFDIVNQLDLGASLIASQDEKDRIAELDLAAGKKARAGAAYDSAARYFSSGVALLAADAWDTRYETAFALHLHLAECEYLRGDYDGAARSLENLARRAKSRIDAAAVTVLWANLHTTQDRTGEAVLVAIECLRSFGITLVPHPVREDVDRAYEQMRYGLGDRRIEDLIDLPAMTDPETRAAMEVLAALHPPAVFTDNNLLCLVLFHMVRLSLRDGNADASGLGYAYTGAVLGSMFGNYKDGFRFGKLGYDLEEKRGLTAYKAKVYITFAQLSNPWSRHLRTGVEPLRRSFDAAMALGDLTWACYFHNQTVTLMLAKGDPLADAQRAAESGIVFVRKARYRMVEEIVVTQRRFIGELRGIPRNGDEPDEAAYEESLQAQEASIPLSVCWYWVRKLQTRFLLGDFEEAVRAASRAEALLWTSPSFFESAEHTYYAALALAARHDKARPDERPGAMAAIAAHERQLQQWSESCPENFLDRYALVSAERARLQGDTLLAMRQYELAIKSARENGFVQNEAIALEVAARFYRARGFEAFADTYLRDARSCYARWGAGEKVRRIDRLHPRLPIEGTPAAAFDVRAEQLDLLAVVKASQTISSEIVQEGLLPTLLRVVLEQGGAERARLLLARGSELCVEAAAELDERSARAEILSPVAVESSGLAPASVVHYVRRTREWLILDDASAEGARFSADEYMARVRPKSVLCLPISRQAEVIGVLYLENNLVPGAFTAEWLTALSLLASQAAISLENALLLERERTSRQAAEVAERRAAGLYREAQEAVALRDEFISVASHELRTPMTSLQLALQSAMRTGNPEAVAPLVARAFRQSERLSKLIDDLLDVSWIETGQLPLELGEVDLAAIVGEVTARLELDLERARCPVTIKANARVAGRWDRSRLDQVVTNLLANAIKFGPGKPITITVDGDAHIGRLRIEDQGIGIEDAQQERIFERFGRAVSANHYGGLGLGLFTCRKIVEAHGGSIRVESRLGAGAVFTVELPVAGPV
ncbi:ATP-binding sensor histidine kinase [Polyangium aurulentum]|uniref:ATP-binding sensor histidine kinase n=1 Tax=Polyangium aurulentum TaxID=2567896 RepID=UPI0010ADCB09|nr:ATP-binding sensor histidine kinase [Polyangium aurulentum]UQA62702.1 AAA family ATPase [Polyangium aurulentum]